jgi:hypothetical protein
VGTHEYAFSFAFPSHCDLGGGAGKQRDLEVLSRKGEQELLPTMPNSGGQVGFEVTYGLVLKVHRAVHVWEDEVELKFTPARRIATPEPMFVEILEGRTEYEEEYGVGDDGEPTALKAKDSLKKMFHLNKNEVTTKSVKVRFLSCECGLFCWGRGRSCDS